MSKYINPKSVEEVKLLSTVGTPAGNAVVVGLMINGVLTKHTPTKGTIVRKTGKGFNCGGGAVLAASASDLGYFRYDQLTAASPTFRRPRGIVAD